MAGTKSLEQLPMTMGYFRLILRCFGDTPERRRALLEGTGVTERELVDSAAEISLFQQVRQVENVSALHGPGWALTQPELWNPTAHGALGIAVLAAPTLGDGLAALSRYGHVRAPFFELRIETHRDQLRLVYRLTVPLDEPQWLPMIEISYVSVRALLKAALSREPSEASFRFASTRPDYAERVFAAIGRRVAFGAAANEITIPKTWAMIPSAVADASLFRNAAAELQLALDRLGGADDLRVRVERLLRTMPDVRLNADAVARALGVSRRTLARRLKETGTQFRALLDQELRSRASRLIAAEKLSRSDMAEQLGYRDPTSFSRACRRWFDQR